MLGSCHPLPCSLVMCPLPGQVTQSGHHHCICTTVLYKLYLYILQIYSVLYQILLPAQVTQSGHYHCITLYNTLCTYCTVQCTRLYITIRRGPARKSGWKGSTLFTIEDVWYIVQSMCSVVYVYAKRRWTFC